jgi:hypothetical protein
MRKIPTFITALVLPVVPILIAAPSQAAGNVICVGSPSGVACDDSAATIGAAIVKANNNSGADTIRVAAGTYSDGPYQLSSGTTLQGAGDATILTLAAGGPQTYVTTSSAAVRDLKVKLNSTTTDNDIAISSSAGSTIANVTVDGAGVGNARGLVLSSTEVSGSTVVMTGAGSVAAYGGGSVTIADSTLTADSGYIHSAPSTTDVLSRVTLHLLAGFGVSTDSGTVEIDNSVVDLGTSNGSALQAANYNNSTSFKAIDADHVTIVGGGASSRGVWSYAAATGAQQVSAVTLTNSIVRGPATSLAADAGNDGAQGGSSSATLAVTYTDYQTKGGTISAHGTGGVTTGTGAVANVDPLFVNPGAGNWHLSPGSAAIDAGNPAAGAAATDRDNHMRVQDGDANGTAIGDLGAYEVDDLVAPQTTIASGPGTRTRDTSPTFAFASDQGAVFECQVDAGPYVLCASPFTTATLSDGVHVFRVRATDQADNTDTTPAIRAVTVDTKAPGTRFTLKPGKTISVRKVRFKFASTEAGSHFACRLDRGAWKACRSPRAFTVAKGTHVFSVRAADLAGNVDKTPAVYRFKRK